MDEAQHLADRIIILRAGEIAADGTAEELSQSLGNRTQVTFTLPEGVAMEPLTGALGTPVELDGRIVPFWHRPRPAAT